MAAIKALPDADSRGMCLEFAQMEVQLGEFERARGVYGHAAQFSDPKTCPSLWDAWHGFELRHGTEDTLKDMLRVKRAVQVRFNEHAQQFVPSTTTSVRCPCSGLSPAHGKER